MQWFFCLDAWLQALIASLFMYAMTALGAACVFCAAAVGVNMYQFHKFLKKFEK